MKFDLVNGQLPSQPSKFYPIAPSPQPHTPKNKNLSKNKVVDKDVLFLKWDFSTYNLSDAIKRLLSSHIYRVNYVNQNYTYQVILYYCRRAYIE